MEKATFCELPFNLPEDKSSERNSTVREPLPSGFNQERVTSIIGQETDTTSRHTQSQISYTYRVYSSKGPLSFLKTTHFAQDTYDPLPYEDDI